MSLRKACGYPPLDANRKRAVAGEEGWDRWGVGEERSEE